MKEFNKSVLSVITGVVMCTLSTVCLAEMIGKEAVVGLPERAFYNRVVNFRPENMDTVTLNPPVFSWYYSPDPTDGKDERVLAFRFQVAYDKSFSKCVIDIRTGSNMYNMLEPFENKKCFWRIGYIDPKAGNKVFKWSKVHSFTLAENAQEWDRSMLAEREYLLSKKHPRMVFTKKSLPAIRELVKTDPASRRLWARGKGIADRAITSEWWKDPKPKNKWRVGGRLESVMYTVLAWHITGDDKYINAKPQETLVKLAKLYVDYGLDRRDMRHGIEIRALAMSYDWLYGVMTEKQRAEVRYAIERNSEWLVKYFWWKKIQGKKGGWAWLDPKADYKGEYIMSGGSGAKMGGSHQIDNFNNGMLGALAIYDESEKAMELLHLGMNAMIAKPYPLGSAEGLNEGTSYSASVFSEVINLQIFYEIAFPEALFTKNPFFKRAGDWFARVLPVGITRSYWGHCAGTTGGERFGSFGRELALITGSGTVWKHWKEQTGGKSRKGYVFFDIGLPYYYQPPKEETEKTIADFFPGEGWVMASTYPPSTKDAYDKGVGMIFHSRPRGGYSHSLWDDLSFHLYAYGQSITHEGGCWGNYHGGPHSMNHNTFLIDGIGQAQRAGTQMIPYYGRLFAFKEHPRGLYVYCAADGTNCYPKGPVRAGGWWGGLARDVYYKGKGLTYLKKVKRHILFMRKKYFIMFDEFETHASHPSRFTWLYHFSPYSDTFNREEKDKTLVFTYYVENVLVKVVHTAQVKELEVDVREKMDSYINPFTGEDYTKKVKKKFPTIATHNLWITNKEPKSTFHFMTVIYPLKYEGKTPEIKRLDDYTVKVTFGKEQDIVSFDPDTKHNTTLIVDLRQINARDSVLLQDALDRHEID